MSGRPAARALTAALAKPTKYGAIRCEFSGMQFDSRLELRRWHQLTAMQALGEISHLERQVRFPLIANGVKLGDYIADFRYVAEGPGMQCREVIEDAKGVLTPLCAWKLKHMAAQGNPVTLWPAPTKKAKPRKVAIK